MSDTGIKIVKVDKNTTLRTQWLNTQEAATYCGMSVESFYKKNKVLPMPYGGSDRTKRYFIPVIDAWMKHLSGKEVGNGNNKSNKSNNRSKTD